MYECVGVEVQVEVILLDIFAMVALGAGQAEQPLLEDGVLPAPERQRETEPLLVVADAGQAVLIPAIDARARVIVRKIFPGVAIRAVIFAPGPRRARSGTAPTASRPRRPLFKRSCSMVIVFSSHNHSEIVLHIRGFVTT